MPRRDVLHETPCTLPMQLSTPRAPDMPQHTARPASAHARSTEELGEREGLKGEPSRDHRDESAESLTRLQESSESRAEILP
jgi:hypothetical protein